MTITPIYMVVWESLVNISTFQSLLKHTLALNYYFVRYKKIAFHVWLEVKNTKTLVLIVVLRRAVLLPLASTCMGFVSF